MTVCVFFFFKMLHYFAKDFYAPVIASPFVHGTKFQIFVISDLTKVLCHYLFPSVPSLKKKKHIDVPSGHFILKFRIVNCACSSNTSGENAK